MRTLERFLINLDDGASSIALRMVIGLAIPPVFRLLLGGDDRIWSTLALFVGLLIVLRAVPAVCRHVLPFSAEAKAIWSKRRQIAKQHDSYQWHKLFWVGLGLLIHTVTAGGLNGGETVIAFICLVGGGVGLLLWSRAHGARARS